MREDMTRSFETGAIHYGKKNPAGSGTLVSADYTDEASLGAPEATPATARRKRDTQGGSFSKLQNKNQVLPRVPHQRRLYPRRERASRPPQNNGSRWKPISTA